ncbi:hypothetical protein V8E36_002679 [Tilletia maclaganii]
MVRGAAIFAAKYMVPVTIGIIFKALHAVSGFGCSDQSKLTARTGVLLNESMLEEDQSLKGLPKGLGPGTTFLHDLCAALQSSSGHNLPTPRCGVLAQAFKRHFKTSKSGGDLPRRDVSYLEDVSTYGRLLQIDWYDGHYLGLAWYAAVMDLCESEPLYRRTALQLFAPNFGQAYGRASPEQEDSYDGPPWNRASISTGLLHRRPLYPSGWGLSDR